MRVENERVDVAPEVIDSEQTSEDGSPGIEAGQAIPSERDVSTTVGTGSYVAVTCTAIALVITFVILGVLFLFRWIQ